MVLWKKDDTNFFPFTKAQVPEGLIRIAGPFGVRRFIIGFSISRGKVQIQRVETITLGHGGGPPSKDTTESRKFFGDTILALHKIFLNNMLFSKGALGFVRDANGNYSILPYFGEDSEYAQLDDLPKTQRRTSSRFHSIQNLRAKSQQDIQRIQSKTHSIHQDWDQWSIANNQLTLQYTYPMFTTQHHRCQVLSTFSMQTKTWTWQVEEPLLSEPIFVHYSFCFLWMQLWKLGFICCAHLKCDWLLAAEVEGSEEGLHLIVAVWDGQ